MLKRILLSSAALTFCAGVAMAQSTIPGQTNNAPNSTPAAAQTHGAAPSPNAENANTATGNSMVDGKAGNDNASSNNASTDKAGSQMSADASDDQQDDPHLFSNLEGADIAGTNGEEVGRLADIIVDSQGSIKQIVIGHGGVAGVGETLRAYDQTSLPTMQDDKIQLGLTTAALEQLPEFDYPDQATTGRASTSMDTNATSADGNNNQAAATGGNNATAMNSANDANAKNSAAASTKANSLGSGNWPVSYLVGANITNANESAEIDDLRFSGNKVDRVVIDHGGVFGLGSDQREIAFNQLKISGDPTDPQIELQGAALNTLNQDTSNSDANKGDANKSDASK